MLKILQGSVCRVCFLSEVSAAESAGVVIACRGLAAQARGLGRQKRGRRGPGRSDGGRTATSGGQRGDFGENARGGTTGLRRGHLGGLPARRAATTLERAMVPDRKDQP